MDTWKLEYLPADQQAAEVVRIYNEETSRMFQITPIDPDKILRELVEQVIVTNRKHAQSHVHCVLEHVGERAPRYLGLDVWQSEAIPDGPDAHTHNVEEENIGERFLRENGSPIPSGFLAAFVGDCPPGWTEWHPENNTDGLAKWYRKD